MPAFDVAVGVKTDDRDLGHAIADRAAACGFNVDEGELAKLQNRRWKREGVCHVVCADQGLGNSAMTSVRLTNDTRLDSAVAAVATFSFTL